MLDVFISYARSSAVQAQQMAATLRALSYEVWWDDQLPAHQAYAEVIEERLRSATAVVVIWSAEATKSQWVRAEADVARQAGSLVQLSIDGVMPPLPFNQIQCVDLNGWSGETDAPGWSKILAGIDELVGAAHGVFVAPEMPRLTSKHSIAVMPFANLSNDPEQQYFADGMVEEIVGALARFKSIFVVSAGSNMILKGRLASPWEAARQLGVRYLLEGSVRKAADRVRIAVHLVDASDGAKVWADRFDDTLEDIFALQDRVAERVAGVIEMTVQDIEVQEVSRRPTTSMGSYDLFLRSLPLFRASRKAEMLQSIELLDRAIDLDPSFGLALSQSCVCHRQVVDHRWCDDPEAYRRRGLELVERALNVARGDAKVLAQIAASLPGLEGRLDRALTLIDQAIAVNPASSFVWLISGSLQVRNGQPDVAAQHLETSMRIDPISTNNAFSRMYLASARFQQGRFREALALFRTTSFRLPVSYAVLAALHGHLGQIAQAQEALSQFEDVSAGTIEEVARMWFPRAELRKLFLDGIGLAAAADPAESA